MKMKLLFLLTVLICSTHTINAQMNDNSASGHRSGAGIHFGAFDFYGPQTDKYFTSDQNKYSFNTEKSKYDTSTRKVLQWRPLVKFTYWWELNRHVDLSLGLSFANLEYPLGRPDSLYVNRYKYNVEGDRNDRFLGEFDARVNYNILPKEEFFLTPYLFTGITASYHDIFFGADIPLGIGFNFNLSKSHNVFLNLESAYKVSATDHDQNHLQHSIGFVYWFKPGYKKPVAEAAAPEMAAPKVMDSDNDGIPDDQDQCPTIAGTAQFNGCPDSDGDGISDKDDACPLVAGLPQFNGCPDTDGDGIPDNTDKCPYVAGTADRQGCPPPDRDHDGVLDDVDRCPDVAGPASNNGCPEIRTEVITQVEKAAKAIFFETGKTTIKKISFKSLDAVVGVLKSDPSLYADIEGHTDNVKPKTYTNMELSQKRAESVRDYLVSKGIDGARLTAQGFGDTQPIADNKTAPGRAQNRRTVIKLRNFSK